MSKIFSEKIAMLLSLNMGGENNKHLFGSLVGNGSVFVICAIVVLAILAVIIVHLRKKKKGSKGEKENE